jgi:hypothetical protein
MKKHHIISLAVGIAALLSILVWKLWPRQLPSQQCDSIFLRYENNKHVSVAYFKDFSINDTTLVDVTTLHALTDSAWNALCDDFISPHYSNEEKEAVVHGNTVTYTIRSRKNTHIKPNPLTDKDIDYVALCPNKSTICFYHIENIDQITNIIFFNTNHLKK